MQPDPQPGFIVAKEKKAGAIADLGFSLPESMGSERDAALAEVVAVGAVTPDIYYYFASANALSNYVRKLPQPGDLIAYGAFSATKITLGIEEWLFVQFKDVMGVFKNAE